MSERILQIETCEECSHFERQNFDSYFCAKMNTPVEANEDGIFKIPEECELKKVEDYLFLKHGDLKELFDKYNGVE